MDFSFDVLSQIASSTNIFSQTEAKLAQYITQEPAHVLSLSISDLAAGCNVSLATVSRFCRRLGLNGYQEFRLELMRSLTRTPESELPQEILPEDSLAQVVSKVTALHHEALNRAEAAIDTAALQRVCDMIDWADDVHFVGGGNMLPVALSAKLQFMSVSTKFHCDLDPASQALSACLMSEKSLVILFSYTGATRDAVEIAKMSRDHGASVVAVSRYSQSPLSKHTDAVVVCGVSKGSFQYSSMTVNAGLHYIVDLLYIEYCRRHPAAAKQNKEKTMHGVVGGLL